MKIKNLSDQNLNLSLIKKNGSNIVIQVKPNQVLYSEDIKENNKQLLIYEKKKLIYINREIDKPEFVDYYKPFFESGESQVKPKSNYLFVDEDEDVDEVDTMVIGNINSFELSSEDDFDSDEPAIKKGRGRPKGTKKVIESENKEKKGRGRPKGSVKNKKNEDLNPNESKRGRGRPKKSNEDEIINTGNSTIKQESKKGRGRPRKDTIVKPEKIDNVIEQKKGRGRPKGSIKKENNFELIGNAGEKRGRGRPKGSVKKNNEIKIPINIEKVIGRKRGRPRKFNF